MDRRGFLKEAVTSALSLASAKALPVAADGMPGAVVRFGVVSDIHYAERAMRPDGAPVGDRYYSESCAKLREAVGVMNASKVDFLIELGDFKDLTVNREGTLRCLDAVEATFAGFSGDRFHVPGNHDFDCLTPEEFFAHVRNAGQERTLAHYSFVRNGVTFIVLDGCYDSDMRHYSRCTPWYDSNIPPHEVAWLKAELDRAAGKVIVFCHQRLDVKAWERHAVRNAAEIRALMETSGKVLAVFTGHEHFGGGGRFNGIAYYSIRGMVVGQGEDESGYAVVSVLRDGTVSIKGYRKAESVNYSHSKKGQGT